MLVSLDETKLRLRFDHDVEDDDIELLIQGASELVLDYLKLPYDEYDDSSGEVVDVPKKYVNATLTLVDIVKRGIKTEEWEHGYLPVPVVSQLYMSRDPSLA